MVQTDASLVDYPRVTTLSIKAGVVNAMPVDYLDELITIISVDVDGLVGPRRGERLGTMRIDKISVREARDYHVPLREICDFHSSYLLTLFDCVFLDGEQPCDEFEIEADWVDILVLWQLDIEPAFRTAPVVVKAIETAIGFLGPRDLVVAAMSGGAHVGLTLTVAEWNQLGFERVPGIYFSLRNKIRASLHQGSD
jgi:hypothetical protein